MLLLALLIFNNGHFCNCTDIVRGNVCEDGLVQNLMIMIRMILMTFSIMGVVKDVFKIIYMMIIIVS